MGFSLTFKLNITDTLGTSHAVEFSLPGSFSDRIAFEREMRLPATVLDHALDEMCKPGESNPGKYLHDEWLAFWAWRALKRAEDRLGRRSFADFIEELEEVVVSEVKWGSKGSVDPTPQAAASDPAPTPGSAPSSPSTEASPPTS